MKIYDYLKGCIIIVGNKKHAWSYGLELKNNSFVKGR